MHFNSHLFFLILGALTVLPSILWLLTGVLKESAWRHSSIEDLSANPANSSQINTSLQGLKAIATSAYAQDERCRTKWSELLQSTLLRILDLAKTAPDDDHKLDEVSLLLAVTVFILHVSDKRVICSPNILYPSINAFTQCFQSPSPVVRQKCVRTLQSIFRHPDREVSVPYVRTLSQSIFEYLLDESSRAVKSEEELLLTLECVKIAELMVSDLPEPGQRSQLLGVVIPILISHLLLQQDLKEPNTLKLKLHDHALAKLIQFGQIYPKELKEVLAQYAELKTRLEAAVIGNQARLANAKTEANLAQQRKVQEHKPSIKLTMDFSKFTAK